VARLTVRLPTVLRPAADGRADHDVDAATAVDALHRLTDRFPGLRRPLFRADGPLRESTVLFLNDQELPREETSARRVADGDVLTVVPAVAGGRPSPAEAGSATAGAVDFAPEEIRRYSRHLLLPDVGLDGQRRLRSARVLVVGAGGLGSPVALYLAAAGVGTIGLVDADRVDVSNLQRQLLYDTRDVGRPKVERAAERLTALNPAIQIAAHPDRLEAANALEILRPYDVVVDGSDNFPTRYLVNDACVLLGKPDVFGSVYRFEGQVTVFDSRRGPCYRCLFPEPPPPDFVPSCAEGGVLGVLPGLIGEIQATEALKLLLGIGEPLVGRLLLYDALEMRFRELGIARDPECVVSGTRPTQRTLIDYPAFCGVRDEPGADGLPSVTATELAHELAGADPPLLLDVRQPGEWAIGHLPGAVLIPRSELGERVGELGRARSIVVYCSAGVRSAGATRLLLDLGLTGVRHLAGGLRAWSDEVDPTMPQY
jgi:sulfur-carrier protein adenylyltransferase/sulfurtransferase